MKIGGDYEYWPTNGRIGGHYFHAKVGWVTKSSSRLNSFLTDTKELSPLSYKVYILTLLCICTRIIS